jgi:hypothetical protein
VRAIVGNTVARFDVFDDYCISRDRAAPLGAAETEKWAKVIRAANIKPE